MKPLFWASAFVLLLIAVYVLKLVRTIVRYATYGYFGLSALYRFFRSRTTR